MGRIELHRPVLLLLAAFSRHEEALEWAGCRAEAEWGPLGLRSQRLAFRETEYYARTMGEGLWKAFFAMANLIDPARLPAIKRQTNQWEAEYAAGSTAEPRPLNLDPGYLTLGKLVLASTKDHAHRVYLGEGIYAEVTLYYRDRQWRAREWTFADYRRADYQQFFSQCRDYYRQRCREDAG